MNRAKGIAVLWAAGWCAGLQANPFYVSPDGGNVAPFTSWADAATDLQAATAEAAKVAESTVWVSNGTYRIGAHVTVGNFKVRSWPDGVSNRDATIVAGMHPATTNRCFFLNHAGALVEGFTITNGYAPTPVQEPGNLAATGGGVRMTAGTLRHCRVVGNHNTNRVQASGYWSAGNGGGVYAYGASCLIEDCEILTNSAWFVGAGAYLSSGAQLLNSRSANNFQSRPPGMAGAGAGAGAAVVSGALVANCIIEGNRGGDVNFSAGGGLDLSSGGRARNCLIRDNFAWTGAGVSMSNQQTATNVLENCTIVSNRCTFRSAGIHRTWHAGPSLVANCISYYNQNDVLYVGTTTTVWRCNCMASTNGIAIGAGNFEAAPQFADFDGGDYRLRGTSPCRDAGEYSAWMADALDLEGNRRVDRVADRVDIGCYEHTARGGLLLVR